MKGTAKLIRQEDGKYHVFTKNYFWQKWKPLDDIDGNEIVFETFAGFGEITEIESFDEIIIKYDKFSGLKGK